MKKDTYDKIVRFANSSGVLTEVERSHIIRNILSNYYAGEQGRTPQEEDTFVNTLLNREMLPNFTNSANKFYQEVKDNNVKEFQKTAVKNFWKNVWASLLASFIFAIVLIVLYAIAKDQAPGLLQHFSSATPQIPSK